MILLSLHVMKNARQQRADSINYNNAAPLNLILVQHLSELFMKETVIQGFLFTGGYILVNAVPAISLYLGNQGNDLVVAGEGPIAIMFSIFYPLGGLFNIIIYC